MYLKLLSVTFLKTCHNMPESGQNCPDAANIEMSQAWFWHITVCLQGYKNTSRLFREDQNGSAYYWIY